MSFSIPFIGCCFGNQRRSHLEHSPNILDDDSFDKSDKSFVSENPIEKREKYKQ